MGWQWAVRQQRAVFYVDIGIGREGEGEGWQWFGCLQGVNNKMRERGVVYICSRRAYRWLVGLFDGGGELPSSLLLLLEGKDGSGWSVAGKGGGGVLPTGAARAGSQFGWKKNTSCSGSCAKGAICSGCGMAGAGPGFWEGGV